MKRLIDDWRAVKPEAVQEGGPEHTLRMLEHMRSDILELGAQVEQARALLEIKKQVHP